MSAFASALYVGQVTHRRLRPRKHSLRYRTYALLLDLDELDALDRDLCFFSHNAFNLFSFFDRDHGAGGAVPLREQIEGLAQACGVRLAGGRIRLLAMPRILGYAFNPLSVYFCHGADGALAALLYEVNNTFGERHAYFIPVAAAGGVVRQSCAKRLYVSPFVPMEATYEFTLTPPAQDLSIVIVERDANGVLLIAAQRQRRRELSDAALFRLFFSHPLLTLKVIVGIHFEALRLWAKGVRVEPRPSRPRESVTLVAPRDER